MAFNTQGGVVGGVAGAIIGGLAGFFAEHALSSRRGLPSRIASKRHAEYTAGGALIGGAIGAFFGGTQSASLPGAAPAGGGGAAPAAPSGGVANTSDNTAGSYWASLTPAQQQTYQTALYNWYSNNTTAATNAVGGLNINSAADLADSSSGGALQSLTDAYQVATGQSQQNGVVDQATYQAVTQ